MAREIKDIAASVRQRLLNLARNDRQAFGVVLVAFGLERLVYRLSISAYRNDFVLKGGLLVTRWTADSGRFTRDIDFLAFGVEEEATLRKMFSEILAIQAADGLIYDTATLTAGTIREDQIYGGVRLKTEAHLGSTRIPITIDIGFGDALAEPKFEISYQSLLDFPAASVRAYSPATVIAEKFQAVVALGAVNSRMKDFYDLYTLRRAVDITAEELTRAIQGTFARRKTVIPVSCPVGLTSEFAADAEKSRQWSAYSQATDLEGKSLADVTADIWTWLEPICRSAS